MTEEQVKPGKLIAAAALVLGLLGDQLLRAGPWGLNAAIWTGLLALILWLSLPGSGGAARRRWLPGVVAGFALLFAWHDSIPLKLLNVAGIAGALALLSAGRPGPTLRVLSFMEYLFELVAIGLSCFVGPIFLLARDIDWSGIGQTARSARLFSLARGLAIALPILVVFGALFVSADAAFEKFINTIFDIDLASLFLHLFFTGFFSWIAAGYLRRVFVRSELRIESFAMPARASLGITEVALVLGSLNLLFLTFVIVQMGYLFGGAHVVSSTPDLTLAEYARRGFFELIAAGALTLPLLLGGHWLLRKERPSHESIFRWMAALLILLVLLVMASAAHRLVLYGREFGVTEQRIYAGVFMAWLAAVLAWFCLTVLRGRRERFTTGAVLLGFAALLCLHLTNPDSLIVRINSARSSEGKRFDPKYLTSLSLDAVPEMIQALPSYKTEDRKVIARYLLEECLRREQEDWRTWSLAKNSALALIRERQDDLRGMIAK